MIMVMQKRQKYAFALVYISIAINWYKQWK